MAKASISDRLTTFTLRTSNLARITPFSPEVAPSLPPKPPVPPKPPALGGIAFPKSLNDLNNTKTGSHELTINLATELNIPVAASVSGRYKRRVIVLETAAYKLMTHARKKYQVGWAIRLCLTVSEWGADFKTNLPFLAAKAQLGQIQSSWVLQVVGLAGSEIRRHQIVPEELNVETYFKAKRSLENLINAVDHDTTKFVPSIIAIENPKYKIENRYRNAVAEIYALSGILRGWNFQKTITEFNTGNDEIISIIKKVYESFGITNSSKKPDRATKDWVKRILGKIQVNLKK
jgi:hypothetical protein